MLKYLVALMVICVGARAADVSSIRSSGMVALEITERKAYNVYFNARITVPDSACLERVPGSAVDDVWKCVLISAPGSNVLRLSSTIKNEFHPQSYTLFVEIGNLRKSKVIRFPGGRALLTDAGTNLGRVAYTHSLNGTVEIDTAGILSTDEPRPHVKITVKHGAPSHAKSARDLSVDALAHLDIRESIALDFPK